MSAELQRPTLKPMALFSAAILAAQIVIRGTTHMTGVGRGLADWTVLPVIAIIAWIIGQAFGRPAFLLAGIAGAAASWLISRGDWIFFVFLNEHIVERADNAGILQTAPFMVVFAWVSSAAAGIVAAISAWLAKTPRNSNG